MSSGQPSRPAGTAALDRRRHRGEDPAQPARCRRVRQGDHPRGHRQTVGRSAAPGVPVQLLHDGRPRDRQPQERIPGSPMTGTEIRFGVNLMPNLWDGQPATVGTVLLAHRKRLLDRMTDVGLDHVMIGDHVMFQSGLGNDGLTDAASVVTANDELDVYLAVYLLVLRHPLLVVRQLLTVAQLAPGRLSL